MNLKLPYEPVIDPELEEMFPPEIALTLFDLNNSEINLRKLIPDTGSMDEFKSSQENIIKKLTNKEQGKGAFVTNTNTSPNNLQNLNLDNSFLENTNLLGSNVNLNLNNSLSDLYQRLDQVQSLTGIQERASGNFLLDQKVDDQSNKQNKDSKKEAISTPLPKRLAFIPLPEGDQKKKIHPGLPVEPTKVGENKIYLQFNNPPKMKIFLSNTKENKSFFQNKHKNEIKTAKSKNVPSVNPNRNVLLHSKQSVVQQVIQREGSYKLIQKTIQNQTCLNIRKKVKEKDDDDDDDDDDEDDDDDDDDDNNNNNNNDSEEEEYIDEEEGEEDIQQLLEENVNKDQLIGTETINQSRTRKRSNYERQTVTENSVVIESGKEVFKLLTGLLWVIGGGAAQKVFLPFTKKFVNVVGEIFGANEKEIKGLCTHLKYSLSNARRTFTEFITEILVGVLSLNYNKDPPNIALTLKFLISKISHNEHKSSNSNPHENDKSDDIHVKLEKAYEQIFTEEVLMYWFEKRFIERLGVLFNRKDREKFFKKHLYFIGKSKFILSCVVASEELVFGSTVTKKYSEFVDLEFNNNALNVYQHNRGKKLDLVKNIINKYKLNNGNYWNIIAEDYTRQMKFKPDNVFEFFPFKNVINHPLMKKITAKGDLENHKKKKIYLHDSDHKIKVNRTWLLKKHAY
ncbi:homeobox protein araucan-related [Anaeramoeba flamelloides]|uniref:Homeobox protein araucan-related n=1 Tax=Anaeramoeba flamelloides TaxID=1746091 RepID=A0ABQ8X3V8_9EUKA|nr:homeobox protein araucan-related [Anaeramoeba flamelloides]